MLRSILLVSTLSLGLGSVALAAPAARVPAPIVADGTTATAVVLAVPGLRPGDAVKSKAIGGRVDAVKVVADGVITARVLPDAAAGPGVVRLILRAKGAAGKVSADLEIPTRGGAATAITAAASAGTTPGGTPVEVVLALPETAQSADTRTVLAQVSAGAVGPVVRGTDGRHRVTWTPPATATGSQVAVLAVADAAEPTRVVGVVALPLKAEASLTLPAPADSQNVLRHGGQDLGPAKASPAGTVAFTVAVDPRAPSATMETTTPDGRVRTQTVDLETADAPTLAFLPGPAARIADPARAQPVLVAVLDARGAPVTDAPPTLSASRGSLGVARATGVPGVWQSTFTPPAEPGSVTFRAESRGHGVEQKVKLVAAPPTLGLTPSADPIPHGTRSLTATVSGGTGAPALEARGARLGSRPRKTPEGTAFVLTPEADGAGVWLLASPPRGDHGTHVASVDVAGPASAPDAGPLPFTLRATDAAGLPVADATVQVDAAWADDLDAAGTTDAAGVARVWLTPPTAGARSLQVRVGGVPAGIVLGPALDRPGPSAHAPARWLAQEPAPVVAVAPAPATPDAPAPTEPAAPAESTAPAAPTPAAPATASASKPAAAPAGDVPWLRIGVSGGLGGHAWSQDADDGVAGPEDDSTSAGNLPLGIGVGAAGLHAQAWFGGGPLGLDLDLVGQTGDFAGTSANTLRGGLGVQGRMKFGDALSLYGHVGAGTTPGYLVVFEDGDPDDETGVVQRVMGGQVGAGLLVSTPRVHVDLGVRELWAPWPVQTHARLDVGVAVAERISVDLRTGHDLRTMAYEVDGEAVDTEDSLTYVGLGVSFLVR